MHLVQDRTSAHFETDWSIDKTEPIPPLLGLARMEAALGTRKILVVDDDANIRLGLAIRLRANDYDVYLAESAMSAIQIAREVLPDLILLDLGLPDEDGYFVMRTLQESPELARTPVIVLSCWNGFSHEALARVAGAKKFFQKPVDGHTLLQEIRYLLSQA